ncbi:unnamed protein product [Gongylonema pulchrum]|uniref:Uncharacterized protein n=1 Tax=Gongylonema pulchrum TaxID=637853 RepID=A0A183DA56_9BILA|nr:unnamed protein product [Gongylonema pulchrum]
MFASMNSSFSSEVYSIDVGVETDSEMEWITPEMLIYEKNAQLNAQASTSSMQLSTNASQNYTDSQSNYSATPDRRQRRRLRSGQTPSWLNRSVTSDIGNRALDGIESNDKRDISSACHTEYDNAESEGNCSDSEMLDGRLEQLKKALRDCSRSSTSQRRKRRLWSRTDNGNDADIDSVCSSLGASSIFGNLRWSRSV